MRVLARVAATLYLTALPAAVEAQAPAMPACSKGASVNAALPATPVPGLAGGPVSFKVVGQTGGATQAVAVQGSYAYVGVGMQVAVLDVSSPSAPRRVGASDPLGGDVLDIAIAGSLAYVAAGGAGLFVIDISNPAAPGIVGAYHAPGYAEGVAVMKGYAYVADGPAGLRIVNVTNPAKPLEVAAAFKLNYVFGVTLAGTQAYMAAAGAGLLVADVSNPASPVEISRMNTPGYAYGIAASGHIVYLADGWDGLRTVDVADPFHPKDMGSSQTPGWAMSEAVSVALLYVANAGAGIRVMDISSATAPRDLGGLLFPQGHAQRLAISGSHVYVADRKAGLHILDASTPAQPVQVGAYSPLGFAAGVAVAGNYAYVGGRLSDGMRVIDLSIPSQPHEVGTFPFDPASPNGGAVVTAINGFVEVSTAHTNYTVDVSDPAHPKGSEHGYPFGTTRNQVVHGGVLIQANEWGLHLVNISDPLSPCELNFMNFRAGDSLGGGANDYGSPGVQFATGVALSGNLAYVAGGGLWIVDVSDPRNPAKVGEYDDPGVGQPPQPPSFNDVIIAGNFVYAIGQSNAGAFIRVVDITDPRHPTARGSLVVPPGATGWGPSMAVAGNILYIADGGAGLLAVDVKNPDQPSLAGRLSLSGDAWSVVADSRYVYVGAEDGGLVVVQAAQGSSSPQAAASREDRTAALHGSVSMVFPSGTRPKAYTAPAILSSVQPRPHAQASAATCTVTSPADSGSATLRQCLQQAAPGGVITFDPAAFPPKSPAAIKPLSALPQLLAGGLTIDASDAGVVLDGSGTPPGVDGLLIRSNGNAIRGLQITGFSGNGINVGGASNNVVGGDRSRGAGPSGQGNVIYGNGASGIQFGVGSPYDPVCGCWTDSTGNQVIGNYIGLDATGAKALGNGVDGVTIQADGNTVGGPTPAERNIISGNRTYDVNISGTCSRNTVIGNYIGTDAAGRVSLSNGGSWSVVVGGGAQSNRIVGNVIAGDHEQAGISLEDIGTSYNEVIGNYVGLDAGGTVSLGNGALIALFQPFNKIGGKTPQERNLIRTNVSVSGTSDNVIIGNFFGLDATGSQAVSSKFVGVQLQGRHNFVGGPGDGERNVLAGEVTMANGGTNNFIAGNYFGTDATGMVALGNLFAGIYLDTAESNAIQGNQIVGNGYGITLETGANSNWLRSNRILQSAGIQVRGAGNRIEGNALLKNSPNGTDAGQNNLWDNGRTGNYWSDYTGKDANGDGVGDTPYTVAPNGVDRYPLMADPANQPAALVLSQSQLSFSFVVGGPAPAPQSVAIGNSGGGALSWTAVSNAVWLIVSPVSGAAPAGISVSVNPANLAAGTYTGSLVIASSTAANSPATIGVVLTVALPPPPSITSVFNAAGLQPGVSSSAWVSIVGANLSATTRTWTANDIKGGLLPTSLDGVDVKIDGRAAFVYYVSPTQINVLAPDDPTVGPVPVQVSNSAGKSNSATSDQREFAPALFTFLSTYAAAVHADGVYVGKPNLLPGADTRPAQPHETIILFGTGFGPTNPPLPASQVVTQAAVLANPITVRIGGIAADVAFAGLTGSGLVQFNVTLPDLPDGDAPVVIEIAGVPTQAGVSITVQR